MHFPFRAVLFRSILLGSGMVAFGAELRAQDAFEPDDTPVTATPVGNGQSQTRSIQPEGDLDWATFTIGAAGAVNVRIETLPITGFAGDTELWLYESRNLTKELAYNDDAPGSKFSLLNLANLAGGTYYIKVGGVNSGPVGAYTLRANWTDRPDIHEPDNSAATAKAIANGEAQERSIHVANDEDWATFTITSPATGSLTVQTSGPAGDTELWLYGPNSSTTEIGYNDDGRAGKFSEITLPNAAVGTYFVKVTSLRAASTISVYTLTVRWTDPGDLYEIDNTPAVAKSISNGQTQTRSLHVADDVDWTVLTIGRNGATNLRIETAGTNGDTEMWLYGPDNSTAQLAYDDDGGAGAFSLITRATLSPGTYYIKVGEFGANSAVSSYTLVARWTEGTPPVADAFEADDSAATAKPIVNGQSQNRSIHAPGDVDWATFTIGAQGAVNLRIETAGSSGDTEVWLYGPNSVTAQLAYADNGGDDKFSVLNVNAVAPGTYHIKVAAAGAQDTITAYSLRAAWTDVPAPLQSQLINLSIRTKTGTGGETIIVGFVLTGGGSTPTLLRGIGPTLANFGVTGVLADPMLQLYRGPATIAANDNWDTNAATRTATLSAGAFPLPDNSRDAVIAQSLSAGAYTVQISGGSGVALVEAYAASTGAGPRLNNVSARSHIAAESESLIAGFVIAGRGTKTVLIRAIGPGLAPFGVPGALADPKLDVFSGSTLIASNDNWNPGPAMETLFARVGAFALPADSKDAAIQLTLEPGAYSAQITGVNETSGNALIEVYEVP